MNIRPRQNLNAGRAGLAFSLLIGTALGVPTRNASAHELGASSASCQVSAGDRISGAYSEWVTLLEARAGMSVAEFETRAESIVEETFALEAMAAQIMRDDWWGLGGHQQAQFVDVLAQSVRILLVSYFDESFASSTELPRLRPAAEEMKVDDGFVVARYWLVTSNWSDWLSFRLVDGAQDDCRILDFRKGNRGLVRSLRNRVERLLDRYSFQYMVAELGESDVVVLADFEDMAEGEFPTGWTWRSSDDNENKPYRVRAEGGNHYLEATDEGESVIIGNEVRWNLDKYPYISFRVRVNKIPEGGDERDSRKVDSAAGLYFTYRKHTFGKIPESAKYVWSSTLPVGSAVRRKGIGRPWQIVFGSGSEGLGEWQTYVFDLRQAYIDTFGGDPESRTVGIGVLSDANSLKSQAHADYDDIRALREAPSSVSVTSGVTNILPPVGNQ